MSKMWGNFHKFVKRWNNREGPWIVCEIEAMLLKTWDLNMTILLTSICIILCFTVHFTTSVLFYLGNSTYTVYTAQCLLWLEAPLGTREDTTWCCSPYWINSFSPWHPLNLFLLLPCDSSIPQFLHIYLHFFLRFMYSYLLFDICENFKMSQKWKWIWHVSISGVKNIFLNVKNTVVKHTFGKVPLQLWWQLA